MHSCLINICQKRNDFHLHIYAPQRAKDVVPSVTIMRTSNAELIEDLRAEGCEPRSVFFPEVRGLVR